MPFTATPLPHKTIHLASFIPKFRYGVEGNEIGLVTQAAKRAKKGQCRLHVLSDGARLYGFAALSLSGFNDKPAIVLEYLFTSHDQRGIRHVDLGDLTAGEYLLQYCLRQARAMNNQIPISYFTLEPANERLVQYYREKDFEVVAKTHWMFLSI